MASHSILNFVLLLSSVATSTFGGDVESSKKDDTGSIRGLYKKAAVASDNGVCSDIGKDILSKGGNAVDAVIATTICIGVMSAHSSGLGGGHFLTVYTKSTKQCAVFDSRERAPFAANETMFGNNTKASLLGALAIAVPGEVSGFWTAYKQLGGKVPWKSLWEPSIKLCRDGHKVSPALAKAFNDTRADTFNNPDYDMYKDPETKEFLKVGDTVKRPALAQTMEKIANAKDPKDFFYNSEFTAALVDEIQAKGGIITKQDFANYTTRFGPNERPPVYANLKDDLTVCGAPPPSSSSLVASIMEIMDGYNMQAKDVDSPVTWHRFAEAMKFTYGTRYNFGDIDFLPAAKYLAQSLDFKSYGQYIRERISDTSTVDDPYFYGQSTLKWDSGTAHISVIDEDGNAASLTTSINTYFGSKFVSKSSGMIMNNQMDDFSIRTFANYFNIQPSPANKVVPGKRPQSSMSPIVVFNKKNGKVKLAIGAAGGVKIISATAQAAMRVLYLGQNIKEAIDIARIHNQLIPFDTFYEPGFPQKIADKMASDFGQHMNPNISAFGSVVCGINRLNDDSLEANSDWRKGGGYPSGY